MLTLLMMGKPRKPLHLWIKVDSGFYDLTWGGVSITQYLPAGRVCLVNTEVSESYYWDIISRLDALARSRLRLSMWGMIKAIWGYRGSTCLTFLEAVLGLEFDSTVPALVDWDAVKEEIQSRSSEELPDD